MPLLQVFGNRLKASGTTIRQALPPFAGGGGGDAPLMLLTLTANSSGAKTNEPFAAVIPLAAGQLGAGQTLRVYDDDGAGGKGTVLANFQVGLPSTDLASATRLVHLSGIVPSIGSASSRKLHVEASNTAAPSGTAITASDVLATSAQCVVEFDIGGTVYAFDVRAVLAAGSTFSKTDYQLVQIEAGPTRTRWMAAGPPKNAGTAHASGDGLRVSMEITAWKAGTAAVGGGNPITLVEFGIEVMNEDLVRASPAHYWYGLAIRRATSLSDGTLITSDTTDVDGNVLRHSWPRSAPAAGITLSAATVGTGRTCTRDAGVWPADILGAHIAGGAGRGIVTARTSDTQVTLYIVEAFSGTSHTSGTWSIEGVGHHYATRYYRTCSVGTGRTSVALWGDNTSALAPTTRAAVDVLAASKVGLNWDLPFASVSHSMTGLNAMRTSDGARRPLTLLGPQGTNLGDITTFIGQSGGRPDIGPLPGWCVEGVVRCDANGRRKIMENADLFLSWQYLAPRRLSGAPAAGELGVWPRADNGTTYKWNAALTGTLIAVPSVTWWPFDSDTAHHPHPFFAAYLLTGEMVWLAAMQRQEAYSVPIATDNAFNGSGMDKTSFGDPTGTVTFVMGVHQTRGKAWSLRDLLLAHISTPDALDAKVANAKSYYNTRLTKTWDALKFWGPDDAGVVRPGTGASTHWLSENTYRDVDGSGAFNGLVSGPRLESLWQMSMVLIALGWAKELGALDADGQTGWEWLVGWPVEVWNSSATLNRNLMLAAYTVLLRDTNNFIGQPSSWAEVYRRSCGIAPINQGGEPQGQRQPAGTLTLSAATVGSARTATFSNSYFSAGSWYVGGFITEVNGGTAVGALKITAVDSATQVTGDVVAAFSSTTPAIGNVRIPGPHPSDAAGEWGNAFNGDYHQFITAACRIASGAGVQTATLDQIIAFQTGLSGYAEVNTQFRVAKR